MKAWLYDLWQCLTLHRYTDRRGRTWQFDYMVSQKWFRVPEKWL